MPDATEEFFDGLVRSGRGRVLRKTNGTIRFDLENDRRIDHWFVTITNGDVRVSREDRDADLVIGTAKAFFDRMARGEAKPLAAWLRNDIVTEGNSGFIGLLERLFSAPPAARHPRTVAPKHERKR
jgi:putative sterol carrier protein